MWLGVVLIGPDRKEVTDGPWYRGSPDLAAMTGNFIRPQLHLLPTQATFSLIPAGESDGLGVAMVWNTLEIPDKFPG